MALVSSGTPKRSILLTAAATGTSQWINVMGYTNLTFYLKTNGSPGAGTCILEEADFDPTSTVPTTLAGSAFATVTITSGVGNSSQAAFHYAGVSHFVRARIGTAVTVATLDVVLIAA